jgi:hypothetical protein
VIKLPLNFWSSPRFPPPRLPQKSNFKSAAADDVGAGRHLPQRGQQGSATADPTLSVLSGERATMFFLYFVGRIAAIRFAQNDGPCPSDCQRKTCLWRQ